MKLKSLRGIGLLLLLALPTMACGLFGISGDGPPNNAVIVDIYANTSLQPWLQTAVSEFNAADLESSDGDPLFAQLTAVDAGQAVIDISEGAAPTLWIPDESVWVNVLADQGSNSYQTDCLSIAQSPLVIGMWREVAESLGWPGLPLGWLDVGSLAADPSAWNYYSGGQYGTDFRLGHTHPGLSASGASTLLALVQSAQAKTDAVTVTDVEQPIVQASVGAFEGGVAWFSSDTEALGAAMQSRGITYLGAGVMYESTVLQYGNGDIVPIYPLEGTFMATHPACISQNASAAEQEAAIAFRTFLTESTMQTLAAGNGLRPVNAEAELGTLLTEENGVDLAQPERVFSEPSVDTIYAVQELWQSARKDVNLVMLLDTSGSMRGSKMDSMLNAAVQFVSQMGDDDYISIIAFSTEPQLIVQHEQVGPNRDKIINAIARLRAEGDTTLFDAVGDGTQVIVETTSVDTTNAMVVLTDGQDTRSYRYTSATAVDAALASNATLFTIAYGSDADEDTLSRLALNTNGNFYVGDEASIAAIYDEMSAAFGGSVGVGR